MAKSSSNPDTGLRAQERIMSTFRTQIALTDRRIKPGFDVNQLKQLVGLGF